MDDDWSQPMPITAQAAPTRLAKIFMWMGSLPEWIIRRMSRIPNKPFYTSDDFPWVKRLELHTDQILPEVAALLRRREDIPGFQEISDLALILNDDRRWKAYFLTGYGVISERSKWECPATWRALREIPGLTTAIFTIMESGVVLPPHRGPYAGVLRLHLGLVVPTEGEVGIRVGNEMRSWKVGETLIFDDTYRHAAWNRSSQIRVVLFVDFVRPTYFPAHLINSFIIRLARFSPFIRQATKAQRAWERKLSEGGTSPCAKI
jgi:beta-hydroxylase